MCERERERVERVERGRCTTPGGARTFRAIVVPPGKATAHQNENNNHLSVAYVTVSEPTRLNSHMCHTHTTSHQITSDHIIEHHIRPYHTTPHHITSHIKSHYIKSHHVTCSPLPSPSAPHLKPMFFSSEVVRCVLPPLVLRIDYAGGHRGQRLHPHNTHTHTPATTDNSRARPHSPQDQTAARQQEPQHITNSAAHNQHTYPLKQAEGARR